MADLPALGGFGAHTARHAPRRARTVLCGWSLLLPRVCADAPPLPLRDRAGTTPKRTVRRGTGPSPSRCRHLLSGATPRRRRCHP